MNIRIESIGWKVLGVVATAALTATVSWGWWATQAILDRPTVAQTAQLIQKTAPYAQDRGMISAQIKHVDSMEGRLVSVIDRNTEAINMLRVEIAKIQGPSQ